MNAVIDNTLLHSRLQPADSRDAALLLNSGAEAAIWRSSAGGPEQLLGQIQRQVAERRKRGQSAEGISCEIRLRTEINSGVHSRAKVVIPLDQLSEGRLRAGTRELWKSFGERIREVCLARGITLSGLEEAFVRQFETPSRHGLAAPRRQPSATERASRPRPPRGSARPSVAMAAQRGLVRARRSPVGDGARRATPRRKLELDLAAWTAAQN